MIHRSHPAGPRTRWRPALVATLVLMLAVPALAGWLRPVGGAGHFRFVCDAMTLPGAAGGQDVVVMLSVEHREITFEDEAGRQQARLRVEATLAAPDGREVVAEETFRLTARDAAAAAGATLRQEFPVVLRGVPFTSGRLTVVVDDLNRRRPGLAHLGSDRKAQATAAADWWAPPARAPRGLSIGDAVFLAHAPIRAWERTGRPQVPGAGSGPWDHAHPRRRYGLEVPALQLYFMIEPPVLVEDRQRAAARPLRVEITSDHLDFALRDTFSLAPAERRVLAAGQPVAVYWEMDAGGLPPGSFRLGIAPQDTTGRGMLTGFDVVWSLQQLTRSVDRLLGEGRTVLSGEARERFEAAPRVEKELILDRFWEQLDPTPADPYNEVAAEFQQRLDYVETYLGGLTDEGPADPRGRIYLLLGPPDSVHEEALPLNVGSLEDARIMVYERYAPERQGQMVRGGVMDSPQDLTGEFSGAIPMPYSYLADKDIRAHKTAADTRTFQLWRYEDDGDQLFLNSYSGQGGGLRFLFVDKTGTGEYVLDSDNTRLEGG